MLSQNAMQTGGLLHTDVAKEAAGGHASHLFHLTMQLCTTELVTQTPHTVTTSTSNYATNKEGHIA